MQYASRYTSSRCASSSDFSIWYILNYFRFFTCKNRNVRQAPGLETNVYLIYKK